MKYKNYIGTNKMGDFIHIVNCVQLFIKITLVR
jgi:hypothetical protein